MADIFISYARADREKVEMLAAALEQQGYSVWWDTRIQSGSEFSKDIEAELEAAKAVIVCWSASANDSRWVKDEAGAGVEADKLLTISVDGEKPPIGFRQFHCADLSHWKGQPDEAAFQDFNEAVRARVSGEALKPHPIKARKASWANKLLEPIPLAIIAVAAVAIAGPIIWFASSGGSTTQVERGLESAPRIAVAPIKVVGEDPAINAMGEALRDEIASGLSKFSALAVASPGKEADAAYRLDATLQKAGDNVRLTGRLLNLSSGEEVWGESYNRAVGDQSVLELQDDLTDHLVASVADPYGGLMRDLHAAIDAKDPATLTPYEAVLQHTIYRQRLSEAEHLISRTTLERAVEEDPNNADVWAALSAAILDEYKFHYNALPDSRARALAAAERATEIDRNDAFANVQLAEAHYMRQDLSAFKAAAERAIELNPRDSESIAQVGIMSALAGDWERGLALTNRAIALNPNHPGWYWFINTFNEYRLGDYEAALGYAQRINMPDFHSTPFVLTMIHAQLGQSREATYWGERLRETWPGDLATFKEDYFDVWHYAQPEFTAHMIDGLEKAGLDIDGGGTATQVDRGLETAPRIAVAPIKVVGEDQTVETMAAALRDEIAAGLSKFSALAVASPGNEAGAAYRLEATLQKAGDSLRLTGRLLNLSSGEEVWGNSFNRTMGDQSALELQDDLTDHLVASVADSYGGLMRDLYAQILTKDPAEMTPFEATLQFQDYRHRLSEEYHLTARTTLERAVKEDPNNADVWATFSAAIIDEYKFGYNVLPNSRTRGLAAAERAIEIDRNSAVANSRLAEAHFSRKDLSAFRPAAERTIELNPRDTESLATLGMMMAYSGDWERGISLTERAMALNPNHPGWYWFVGFFNEFRQGNYETALDYAQRINMPDFHAAAYVLAMTHAELGQMREAEYAAERFRALWPDDIGTYKERQLEAWLYAQPELIAQIVAALEKAGLDVDGGGTAAAVAAPED